MNSQGLARAIEEEPDRKTFEMTEIEAEAMGIQNNEEHTAGSKPTSNLRAGTAEPEASTPIPFEGTLTGAPVEFAPSLGPSSPRDYPNQLGCYRLSRKLGEGGMGAVFLAEDTSLHRQVALKVMRAEVVSQSEAGQRFLREARSMAALKQDNIVTIYAVGEDQGIPYLAMELLKGTSLDAFLKSGKMLSIKAMLRISREIARGLSIAHSKGLIHRDIKPGNIWLEAPVGRVKILDFGLARPAAEAGELTASGMVVGTPNYMSPEQARGEKVDARADLFSLGVLMYRMATGRVPFQGPTLMSVLMAIGTETQTSASSIKQEIPVRLSKLIDRLLAKNRDDRPESAEKVIAELLQIEKELGKEMHGQQTQIADPGLVIDDVIPMADQIRNGRGSSINNATSPIRGSSASRKHPNESTEIDDAPEVVDEAPRKKKKKKAKRRKTTFPIVVGVCVLILGIITLYQAGVARRASIQQQLQASEPQPKPKPSQAGNTPETGEKPTTSEEGNESPSRKESQGRKGGEAQEEERPEPRFPQFPPPKKDFPLRKGPFGKKDHPPKKDDGGFGDE